MAGKASFFSWLLTPVGLAAALTSLVVLVVVLAVLFLISELMKPTPKNGTPATLPNGMKIMQWQSSETTFLYEEIFGSESAYSQRGEGKIDFKPGSVIFDCGANIGMFSLYAAMRCKGDATIYSFEPIGSTYNVMAANAAAANRGEYSKWFGGNNLRIVPLNKGCSDVKAEVEFEHHPNFSVWSTQDATFAQARLDRIAADLPRATA
jgi:FkbM family methyltransferase